MKSLLICTGQVMSRHCLLYTSGHVQRGGIPSASDRILATRIGVEAAGLILRKDYGNMVCIKDGKFSKIPLEEVAGKTKMVNVDNELIRQAESLGISLGRKA